MLTTEASRRASSKEGPGNQYSINPYVSPQPILAVLTLSHLPLPLILYSELYIEECLWGIGSLVPIQVLLQAR